MKNILSIIKDYIVLLLNGQLIAFKMTASDKNVINALNMLNDSTEKLEKLEQERYNLNCKLVDNVLLKTCSREIMQANIP